MPAAHDLDDDEERAGTPDFVDDDSQTVGFVDLRDLDVDQVMAAVVGGFSRLGADAVLTAYCTTLDEAAMTARCERHGVELVHSVWHGPGITFVLRRPAC